MYQTDAFFWYKALFTLELLFAESLMVFRLKRRTRFVFRALASLVVCVGVALAFPVFGDGAAYATLLFLSLFVVTLGALFFCFEADFRTILFCGLAGYATQHIAYVLFDISTVLMGIHNISGEANIGSNPFASLVTFVYGSGTSITANAFVITVYGALLFVTYWAMLRIVSPRLKHVENLQLKNGAATFVFALTIIFDIVMSVAVTEYGGKAFDGVYIVMLDITNLFLCLLALYLMFSLAQLRKMSGDLDTISRMWQQSKAQYEMTKNNIDMINMKCHDLKHQVRTIGSRNALKPEAVGEIESIITMYDSGVETGNEALDVILTEKSLLCHHRDIALSCIADGKQLSFINETDLYSLFGNVLDNAIEAVTGLDVDRRVVGLSVKKINGFVFVNVYNYYDGRLIFDGELPRTTKGDNDRHGFGMKSVKMLIEKYGGEMKINAKDGVFNLDIVFPIA